MTLTIDLPPEEIMALKAMAQAQGVSAEQYARSIIEDSLKAASETGMDAGESFTAPRKSKEPPIWEMVADTMRDVPLADRAELPKDGAAQIDHYIYGVRKRTE